MFKCSQSLADATVIKQNESPTNRQIVILERTEQIVFLLFVRSQQNWHKANQAGWFKDEIEPVDIKTKKGVVPMTADEHPKPQVTIEALAKLPTVFKKGTQ